MFYRYVDHCFADFLNHVSALKFHHDLNTIHKDVKFTYELEQNKCYVTTEVRIVPGFFFLLFKLLLPHRVNSVSFSCFNFYCDCIKNLPVITFIKSVKICVENAFTLFASQQHIWRIPCWPVREIIILLELQSICYIQYQLHYSWTLVSPRCRTHTIVLCHCVVLLRLPFIFRLPEKRPSVSFWCNRSWMLYWFNYPKCLFTRCWPWRGFNLYFVIVNRVALWRCGCLCYLILIYRNRPVLIDSINKQKKNKESCTRFSIGQTKEGVRNNKQLCFFGRWFDNSTGA